jgi:hypothetical protein
MILHQPILSLGNTDLLALVEHSLANTPPDIELATIAYDEARRRKRHQTIKEAREIFSRKGIHPIPWLSLAKQTLSFLVLPPAGNYQGHLYVILVDGYTEQSQFYGAYVGSSRYTPETRFQQHKAGYKSSGIVRNRGIQVLRSLCWPDGKTVPGGRDLVLWESALNRCLALTIPKVRGDHIPIDDWDDTFQPSLRAVYKVCSTLTSD